MFDSKYFPVRSVTLVALQNASAVATLELSGKMGKRGVQGAWAACVDSTDAFRRETVDEKWWSTGFSAVSSELGAEFGPGTRECGFPVAVPPWDCHTSCFLKTSGPQSQLRPLCFLVGWTEGILNAGHTRLALRCLYGMVLDPVFCLGLGWLTL